MRLFQQQPSLHLVAVVVLSSLLFCGCYGATAVDVSLQHEISGAQNTVVARTSSSISTTTRTLLRKQQTGPPTMVLTGVRDDDSDHNDSRKRMLQQGGDNKEGDAVNLFRWLFILIGISALFCFSGLLCFSCCADDLLCDASMFDCL
jgi:hypothetical protein